MILLTFFTFNCISQEQQKSPKNDAKSFLQVIMTHFPRK